MGRSPKKRRMRLWPWLATAIYVCLLLEGTSWLGAALIGLDTTAVHQDSLTVIGETTAPHADQKPLSGWEEVPNPYFGASYPMQGSQPDPTASVSKLEDYGFKKNSGILYRERDPARFIINITGGSVARNFIDHNGEHVLREELLKLPEFKDKEIVFSSTAFYGHREPQQLQAITYLLTQGAVFDMIITLDGFNEISFGKIYNEKPGISPYYPFKWHWYMTQNFPNSETQEIGRRIGNLRTERQQAADFYAHSSLRRSMSATLGWHFLDAYLASRIESETYRLSTAAPNELKNFIDPGPIPAYADLTAFLRDQASVWQRSTLQLARLSGANGARFYSFLQPNQYFGNHVMPEDERLVAWKEDSEFRPLVEQGYPLLQEAGAVLKKEEDVAFADLSGIFDDVKESVYTDNCCHFNRYEANALLGRHMAAFIAESLRRTPDHSANE